MITGYLESLGQLNSPVPNLAATLTTAAEQEDDDEDDFGPRRSRPPPRNPDAEHNENPEWQRPPYLNSSEFRHAHVQRELQRRAMRRAAMQSRSTASTDGTGNIASDISPRRSSSRSHMSYQNWAPGSAEADSARVRSWSTAIRPWQERGQNTLPDPYRYQRETDPTLFDEHPRSSNHYGRGSGLHDGQSHFVEDNTNPDAVVTEPSRRTAALLQSVRRSARISSATSRDQLENWIVERARRRGELPPASPNQEPSSATIPSLRTPPQDPFAEFQIRNPTISQQRELQALQQQALLQRQQARLLHQNTVQQHHATQQQDSLIDYSSTSLTDHPDAARHIEEAIKYLERQRLCTTYAERIASAAMGGFIRGDWCNAQREDFILDTQSIDTPTETSWLRPGSVFSGSQHASNVQNPYLNPHNNSTLSNYYAGASQLPPPRDLAEFRVSRIPSTVSPTYPRPNFPHLSHPSVSSSNAPETWPVKVTIHSVCFDSMTLTGTMEAFNVPDKSSSYAPTTPTKKISTSITTFLTGEILDFNVHTLLTTSWNAKVSIDSTYWRKLGPFKNLSEKEIVAGLVSRKWMQENVYEKWVLMRWKEKCFVTPSDAQSGLTISGFYYVCLRRSDGFLEGLYYDPLSSPYQHLELRAVGRGGGSSYEFQ